MGVSGQRHAPARFMPDTILTELPCLPSASRSGLKSSGYPTKILHAFLISLMRAVLFITRLANEACSNHMCCVLGRSKAGKHSRTVLACVVALWDVGVSVDCSRFVKCICTKRMKYS
jgi:hypothetical protein